MLKAEHLKISRYNLIVFFFGLICYFVLSSFLDVEVSADYMFDKYNNDADSYSYLQVGNWIYEQTPTHYLALRPLLFPLILTTIYKVGGVGLFWVFQIMAYCFAHLFLHLAVKQISKSRAIAIVVSIVFLSNFSLIALSYHALTEVLVIFGLSLALYLHSKRKNDPVSTFNYFVHITVILGVLILIKPVFLYPFLASLIVFIIILLRKKALINRRHIYRLLIVSVLLIIQCSVVKVNHGKFKVSMIAELTFRDYLFTKTFQELNQTSREESLEVMREMSDSEIKTFAKSNFKLALRTLIYTMIENIKADSFVENYSQPSINAGPAKYMRIYNYLLFFLFIIIGVLASIQIIAVFIRDRITSIILLSILCLFAYMVFVTGISFGQRDRLVITTLPVWLYLLAGMLNFKNILSGHWTSSKKMES